MVGSACSEEMMKSYLKRNHNFVIEIPATWNECVHLDKDNNNILWQDAVKGNEERQDCLQNPEW
jgi:hypothetical protein